MWRVLLLAMAGLAVAQTPTATLTGVVTDTAGAVMPNVTMLVRNVDTGLDRTFVTNETGDYTIPNLAPGNYELRAEAPGFRPYHETGLTLQLEQTLRRDIQMQVGSVSETIEVRDTTPALNTENASKGDVIVQAEIADMPLDGRDFVDLAYLVPGVFPKARGGQGSALNINGARADNTNFVVDGFNNQNPRGAAAQVRANLDSVLEFKTQVSGYSAEFGRLAGGVINTVLRSGTNQFHGSLFEYLRNDLFDARNFFDETKRKLRRNQFGAAFHGPVIQNRTFFLVSWESYRQVIGQTRLGRVPSVLERGGDFSASVDAGRPIVLRDPVANESFPDNRLPASRFHPAAAKLMTYYPLPNQPFRANNYLTSAVDQDSWDSFVYKIDHKLSGAHSLSFRYLKRYNRNSSPFAGSDLGIFGTREGVHQSLAGLNWTYIVTPALLNEARMGFSRTANRQRSVWAGQDIAEQLGIPGTTTDPDLVGFPRFTIRDLLTLGDPASQPVTFHVNNLQWGNTTTLIRGRHAVKWGFEILRTQFFQPHNNNNRGTFNFLGRWTNAPFADFLLGLLNNTSRQVGTTPNYLFATNYGFFGQNDFRVSRSLTLNLGLRYEIIKPPAEKYNRMANFSPELGQIVLAGDENIPNLAELLAAANLTQRVTTAREAGLPRSLIHTDWTNLAPRLGFAWRPGRGNRTVVRGGYGIFYGVALLNPVRQDLLDVFPFAVIQTFQRQTNNVNVLTLSTPFPDARTVLDGTTTSNGYEVRSPTPYLQDYNLTVEREIGSSVALEIAYVGSKGTHLGRRYDVNQPLRLPELRLPGGGFPRPYTGIQSIDYYSFGSTSIYNAGMISLRRRTRGGVFYRVNYVFSKSIDDASQITGNSDGGYAGAQDARNLKLERGRSDWDIGHAVTMTFSWQLPLRRHKLLRGWQLAGTGRFYTGQPFTVRVSNVQLDQGEANRPHRIAKGRLETRTVERWFHLEAFPPVPLGAYQFGNSGRNILDAPGLVAWNASLLKSFPLERRGRVQMRYELFNVLNRANFGVPQNQVNAVTAGTIREADPGRLMQVALKYEW
jgi:outer membrane receptor protein involved in Fe transport